MTNDEGGSMTGNKMFEIDKTMKEFRERLLAYNAMKKDDTFQADNYEQTEVLLLLMKGLYAVYNQNRTILDMLEKMK